MRTFDEVTRAWAEGVSRREALKLLASATLAAMLAPRDAAAALAAPDTNVCAGIPGSFCNVQPCPNRTCSGLGCYCYPLFYNQSQTRCGANAFCNSSQYCHYRQDCYPGYFCALTCCDQGAGVCLRKCGPRTPCVPGIQPGGGLTAAG